MDTMAGEGCVGHAAAWWAPWFLAVATCGGTGLWMRLTASQNYCGGGGQTVNLQAVVSLLYSLPGRRGLGWCPPGSEDLLPQGRALLPGCLGLTHRRSECF